MNQVEEFLLSWLISRLNEQGLIDSGQLLAELQALRDLPTQTDLERAQYQHWIKELWTVGVLPSAGE